MLPSLQATTHSCGPPPITSPTRIFAIFFARSRSSTFCSSPSRSPSDAAKRPNVLIGRFPCALHSLPVLSKLLDGEAESTKYDTACLLLHSQLPNVTGPSLAALHQLDRDVAAEGFDLSGPTGSAASPATVLMALLRSHGAIHTNAPSPRPSVQSPFSGGETCGLRIPVVTSTLCMCASVSFLGCVLVRNGLA